MRNTTLYLCLVLQLLAVFWTGNHEVLGQETATFTTEPLEDASADVTDEDAPMDLDENQTQDATAEQQQQQQVVEKEPVQAGPLIDLFGPKLQSLQMVDEQNAQIGEHYTNEALKGKNVIGIYFSADWCGPCRQFTPELVSFYEKMNKRRGQKDKFQIVWVSRCRDVNSHYQYFTHMPWLALPPEEALGPRGEKLSNKYRVKGIPTFVLVDDLGNTITTDARNKIPQDRMGVGFPWRNPLAQVYSVLFPRSLRMLVKLQIDSVKNKIVGRVKGIFGMGRQQPLSV